MDVALTTPVAVGTDLLGLVVPFWQLVIGVFVVFAVVASIRRLAARGPTRMTTGLLVTAAAIVALATVGVLFSGR